MTHIVMTPLTKHMALIVTCNSFCFYPSTPLNNAN